MATYKTLFCDDIYYKKCLARLFSASAVKARYKEHELTEHFNKMSQFVGIDLQNISKNKNYVLTEHQIKRTFSL